MRKRYVPYIVCLLMAVYIGNKSATDTIGMSEDNHEIVVPDGTLVCSVGLAKERFVKEEPVKMILTVLNATDVTYGLVLPGEDGDGLSFESLNKLQLKQTASGGINAAKRLLPRERIKKAYVLNRFVDFRDEGLYEFIVKIKFFYEPVGGEIRKAEIEKELHFSLRTADEKHLQRLILDTARGLRSASEEERRFSAQAISAMENKAVIPHLLEGLRSRDMMVALSCADGLAKFEPKKMREDLIAALSSSEVDAKAKITLLRIVSRSESINEQDLRELCGELVKSDESMFLTVHCLRVLRKIGVGELRGLVEALTNDSRALVRTHALEILGEDSIPFDERLKKEIRKDSNSTRKGATAPTGS